MTKDTLPAREIQPITRRAAILVARPRVLLLALGAAPDHEAIGPKTDRAITRVVAISKRCDVISARP